jgi:hypothetical protein
MAGQVCGGARGVRAGVRAGMFAGLAACALGLAGCQADYAVDMTNRTPQPVYVQIFAKGGDRAVLGASRRLGPGDRALVGPVRTDKGHGAYLQVDSMPNPSRPLSGDLMPGTSYLELIQDGEGTNAPMRIVEKR